MLTLILTVCLTAHPGACEDVTPLVDPMRPMACMIQGQQIAAEWIAEHPKWTLTGFRCGAAKRVKGTDI